MLKRKNVTKFALTVSILLLVGWFVLSANASVAWLEADDTIINILNFGFDPDDPGGGGGDDPSGVFGVELYHKTTTGYEEVDEKTKVFDEAALYEPGYTQMVLLRIDNVGEIDFNYDMAVIPNLESLVVAKNVKGEDIFLPEHLRFGLVFDDTEEGLLEKTADRKLAQKYATHELSKYSEDGIFLSAGSSNYCALILYMPEEVSNEANYRGDTPPSVEVGIGVYAMQAE